MINSVILMGRLTADPELKMTTSGKYVCSFYVAVDRLGADGERKTDFFAVSAWQKSAEFVTKYFKKGQMIAVGGYLVTRKYENSQGVSCTATEIIAEKISFCGDKGRGVSGDDEPAQEGQGREAPPRQRRTDKPAPRSGSKNSRARESSPERVYDGDLPF